MRRQALVVGINRYPFLTAQHLQRPAKDAEAIAQQLDKATGDLGWSVQRLPEIHQENKPIVNKMGNVKQADLETAIGNLLHPKTGSPPDVALLFFAGHGFRSAQDGQSSGFLAPSDVKPKEKKWGISLSWLREQLLSSPVPKQIVWLDCCHSGDLMNFTAEELEEWKLGGDRFLVAACRDDRSAYASSTHGVLTEVLLQGLDPEKQPEGEWISSYSLKRFIEKELEKNSLLKTQIPLVKHFGEEIKFEFGQGKKPSPVVKWQEVEAKSEYYALDKERPFYEGLYTNFINKVGKHTVTYGIKVAFSPDGEYFSNVGFETIEVQKLEVNERSIERKQIRKFEHRTPSQQGYFTAVAISSKGILAVNKTENKIIIWDINTGQKLHVLSKNFNFWLGLTDYGGHDAVAFSPDGEILAGSDGNSIRFWNPETGKELRRLNGHGDKVTSIAFSQDGKIIVSGSYDKTIKFWDATKGKLLYTIEDTDTIEGHTSAVHAIAFSPDGKKLVSGSKDKTVKIWDFETRKLLKDLSGHEEAVNSVAFSYDGKIVASGSSDKTVKLWDPITGKPLETLKKLNSTSGSTHSRGVTSVAFSPKKQILVSGSQDQSFKFWQPG